MGHFGDTCSCAVSPNELKKHSVVLKEDAIYQVRIHFYVQREIVQGLKYIQRTYKSGIRGRKLCMSGMFVTVVSNSNSYLYWALYK